MMSDNYNIYVGGDKDEYYFITYCAEIEINKIVDLFYYTVDNNFINEDDKIFVICMLNKLQIYCAKAVDGEYERDKIINKIKNILENYSEKKKLFVIIGDERGFKCDLHDFDVKYIMVDVYNRIDEVDKIIYV